MSKRRQKSESQSPISLLHASMKAYDAYDLNKQIDELPMDELLTRLTRGDTLGDVSTVDPARTALKQIEGLDAKFNDAFTKEEWKLLMSPTVLECYLKGFFTPEEFLTHVNEVQGSKTDVIMALTSENAITLYEMEHSTFQDLARLDNDSLKDLYRSLSYNSITGAPLNKEKVQALTSPDALACYKNAKQRWAYPTLIELSGFSQEKIQSLTSPKAQKCYENAQQGMEGYPTLDDLRSFDAKKIQALTSPDAQKCYEEHRKENNYLDYSPEELAERNETLAILASSATPNKEDAQKLYELKTSSNYPNNCPNNYPNYYSMRDFDTKKIQALTSPEAQQCYKKRKENSNYPSYDSMQLLEVDQIQALTSLDAQTCYDKYCSAEDLKEHTAEDISFLTSPAAQSVYQLTNISPSDFKKDDPSLSSKPIVLTQESVNAKEATSVIGMILTLKLHNDQLSDSPDKKISNEDADKIKQEICNVIEATGVVAGEVAQDQARKIFNDALKNSDRKRTLSQSFDIFCQSVSDYFQSQSLAKGIRAALTNPEIKPLYCLRAILSLHRSRQWLAGSSR